MSGTCQFDSSRPFRAPPHSGPLAARLSWAPLRAGGMPFKTCNVSLQDGVIEVTPSASLILCSAMLMGCGVLMIARFGREFFFGDYSFESGTPMLMGQLLGLGGGWLIRRCGKPFRLNKTKGVYLRGNWSEYSRERSDRGSLSDLYAVQLVNERVAGNQRYASYEINLVCQDGTRIDVLDHNNLEAAMAAGASIAEYLAIPFWRRNWKHGPLGHASAEPR